MARNEKGQATEQQAESDSGRQGLVADRNGQQLVDFAAGAAYCPGRLRVLVTPPTRRAIPLRKNQRFHAPVWSHSLPGHTYLRRLKISRTIRVTNTPETTAFRTFSKNCSISAHLLAQELGGLPYRAIYLIFSIISISLSCFSLIFIACLSLYLNISFDIQHNLPARLNLQRKKYYNCHNNKQIKYLFVKRIQIYNS